jgi:hypothetical protein
LNAIFKTDGFFKGTFPRDGAEEFNAHNERVKSIIPAEKLLVFEVGKEGWGPLCKFLDLWASDFRRICDYLRRSFSPIPDTPFPHVNDTKEFQSMIRKFTMVERAIEALTAAALGTAGYFAARYFDWI